MNTKAQRKANNLYQREKCKTYGLKLIKSKDAELIELLEAQPNKQAFIKQALYEKISNGVK